MNGDWRDRAACRDADPEVFFPVGGSWAPLEQIRAAKAFCARCPVREACLAFALEALPEGIAGGLTPQERRAGRGGRSAHAGREIRSQQVHAAVVMRRKGRALAGIAREFGVSGRTVERWLREASR